MHDTFISGNGNGNKMNLRVEIFENLLNASGDGTSAKINSLRQAIRCNKSDMADNTSKSLDVLRQVFQHEMNYEIRQIIDRHLRSTFAPAFENLRRNGHEVLQSDIDDLCVSILDGAKELYLEKQKLEANENNPNVCIPSYTVLKKVSNDNQQLENFKTCENEDNESDGSLFSHNSRTHTASASDIFNFESGTRPKKRGRPRKVNIDTGRSGTPLIQGTQPVTASETLKWNPERIVSETRFILGSKVNKILTSGHRNHIFSKYTRSFRYMADDKDKSWLFDRNISTKMSGKVFLMILDDCLEIAQFENALPQAQVDLKRHSFLIPDKITLKVKQYMTVPFEKLKSRIVSATNSLSQQQQSQQLQQSLQSPSFSNFIM